MPAGAAAAPSGLFAALEALASVFRMSAYGFQKRPPVTSSISTL
jgi:hypothetical protein